MKTLILVFLCSVSVFGQIPNHKTRNSTTTGVTLLDSAQNYFFLGPNFQYVSQPGNYYESFITSGDIFVEWPKANQVFQRNNLNQGWIYVKGSCTNLNTDSIKVIVKNSLGIEVSSKNIFVDNAGVFEAAMSASGGNYTIEIVEFYTNMTPKSKGIRKVVNNVGVGEVLVAWGHSFMSGPGIFVPSQNPLARTVSATFSDSINPFFQDLNQIQITFKTLSQEVGPFNGDCWFLGSLADTLVNRLNVPVLIYSAAFGGSNVYMNKKNIDNQPFGFTWFWNGAFQDNRFPYRIIEAIFQRYVPKTGVRGMIVHHGINDVNPTNSSSSIQTEANFKYEYEYVLNNIRNNQASFSNMPLFLSFEGSNYSIVNNPIQTIVNNDPYIYEGVDLRNPSTIGPWRDNGYGCNGCGHFVGTAGLVKYLELWKNVIPTSFFSTSPLKEAVIDNALKY
jgi:hypothetical protein